MGLIDESVTLTPLAGKWESLSAKERAIEERTMEVYAAMIDCVDQNIGRLLKKLKELGQEENTLVIFVSDNGGSSENVNNMGNKTNPVIGEMDNWKSVGGRWANVSNTPFKKYKNYSMEGLVTGGILTLVLGNVLRMRHHRIMRSGVRDIKKERLVAVLAFVQVLQRVVRESIGGVESFRWCVGFVSLTVDAPGARGPFLGGFGFARPLFSGVEHVAGTVAQTEVMVVTILEGVLSTVMLAAPISPVTRRA
ncbi:unnamed protein product, partial [marine sediment metagenome]